MVSEAILANVINWVLFVLVCNCWQVKQKRKIYQLCDSNLASIRGTRVSTFGKKNQARVRSTWGERSQHCFETRKFSLLRALTHPGQNGETKSTLLTCSMHHLGTNMLAQVQETESVYCWTYLSFLWYLLAFLSESNRFCIVYHFQAILAFENSA